MRKNAVVIKPTEINSYFKACGKKGQYTKKQAMEVARFAAKRGAGKRMGVYECPHAPHWHVTHKLENGEGEIVKPQQRYRRQTQASKYS